MSLTPVNNNVRPDFSRMRPDEAKLGEAQPKATPTPGQPVGDAALPEEQRVQPTDAQSQGARQLHQGVGDSVRQQIERSLPGGSGTADPAAEQWAGGRRRPPRGGGTVRAQAEPVIKRDPVA